MSGQHRKTLHSIPFFDSAFDYDSLKTQFLKREEKESEEDGETNHNSAITSPSNYSEEGTIFSDLQNQIVNRIKAGFQLDTIERNFALSNNFRGCYDQYSQVNPSIHSSFRGQKTFWSWLNRVHTL